VSAPRSAPGSPVRLRPLTEADFTDRYLAWFRDPEVTRFLEARNISREDAVDHLRRGREGDRWRLYAICEAGDGRHVGNLKVGPIDRRHGVSDLVTVIGERDVQGRGYGRAAISLGIDIAFREMGLRKLSASIDSRNEASLRAYLAAGFAKEATLRDHFVETLDGATVLSDKIHVACFNPDAGPGHNAEDTH